ncbi:MAG TPA: chemotaxis response regulator protein-glutamate methylesterase [Beijerinckiaceae bacterium]
MAANDPIRVLVVDDSATTRAMIAEALSRDPGIRIVGEARDAHEAREAIKSLNPDVMTLDIEMPRMNGLEFLEKVMRLRPFPVVMVSSLTERGAETTIHALEIGAVDCVEKPSPRAPDSFEQLAMKVRAAARAKVGRAAASRAQSAPDAGYEPAAKTVAIGASTGGVDALIEIISRYPANCPPTVITIHMPPMFTAHFARRLDRLSAAQVSEAQEGDVLQPGRVYLAPGGPAHLEITSTSQPRCRLRAAPQVNGHRPSVDVLFNSVAASRGAAAVGVILTGMGGDGAAGLLAMRNAGASTIGQDPASCVIYGMPRVAFEMGAVERQIRIDEIASAILKLTNARSRKD